MGLGAKNTTTGKDQGLYHTQVVRGDTYMGTAFLFCFYGARDMKDF
jgi:hypothetical protein